MRNVTLDERSWSSEEDERIADDATTPVEDDRLLSDDPVMAAKVSYGYARI